MPDCGSLAEKLAFDKRSAVDKRITDVGGGSPAAPGLWTVLSAYVKIIAEQGDCILEEEKALYRGMGHVRPLNDILSSSASIIEIGHPKLPKMAYFSKQSTILSPQ